MWTADSKKSKSIIYNAYKVNNIHDKKWVIQKVKSNSTTLWTPIILIPLTVKPFRHKMTISHH